MVEVGLESGWMGTWRARMLFLPKLAGWVMVWGRLMEDALPSTSPRCPHHKVREANKVREPQAWAAERQMYRKGN